MTVEELVALLKQHPPGRLVRVQGCDCEGEASGVSTYYDEEEGQDVVLIERR